MEVTHETGETSLSFFFSEGLGRVSAADLLDSVSSRNNNTGVSMQRGIEKAHYEMKKGASVINQYAITIPTGEHGNPMEDALGLVHDIRQVFGLEIVKWTVGMKPKYVEVEVLMTSAFEPQIKRVFKTATFKLIDRDATAAAQ